MNAHHRGRAMTGLPCCETVGCIGPGTDRGAKSAVNHFGSRGLGCSGSVRHWGCETACFGEVDLHRESGASGWSLREEVRHWTRKKLRGRRSADANQTRRPRGAGGGIAEKGEELHKTCFSDSVRESKRFGPSACSRCESVRWGVCRHRDCCPLRFRIQTTSLAFISLDQQFLRH